MLFFPENRKLNGIQFKSVKRIATLQVRLKRNLPADYENRGKRVWISVSLKGSVAAEAAFVLPIFLFAAFLMMLPMKVMDRQRQVQAAVDAVCEEMSQYAYITKEMEGAGGILSVVYAGQRILSQIDQSGMENISFLKSRIMERDQKIELVMEYDMKLPFSAFGIGKVNMEVRSIRRAWVGEEEKTGQEAGAEDDRNQIVFTGKDSTRYHFSRDCHYLYNKISSVSADEIEGKRNMDGGKYYPCRICGNGAAEAGQVFIMPRGSSYHTSRYCRAIISYTEGVPLKAVEHLGPCSYCSR